MNLIEYYLPILNAHNDLDLMSTYISNSGDKPYKLESLKKLRSDLESLSDIDLLSEELISLRKLPIYQNASDSIFVSNSDDTAVKALLKILKAKIEVLLNIIQSSGLIGQEDLLSFQNLSLLKNYRNIPRIYKRP